MLFQVRLSQAEQIISVVPNFYQAIILCTRPILLQRARFRVQSQQQPQSPDPAPSMLLRLCDTCDEAATRSLAILDSLRRQQTIRESLQCSSQRTLASILCFACLPKSRANTVP